MIVGGLFVFVGGGQFGLGDFEDGSGDGVGGVWAGLDVGVGGFVARVRDEGTGVAREGVGASGEFAAEGGDLDIFLLQGSVGEEVLGHADTAILPRVGQRAYPTKN